MVFQDSRSRVAGTPYSKCQKFCPNYPENPLFEKSRFSGPFRQKLLSYSEITLMLFRTLPVAPGCNKVPEKEKTSGNRYRCEIASLEYLSIPDRGKSGRIALGCLIREIWLTSRQRDHLTNPICRRSLLPGSASPLSLYCRSAFK
jgi:hypothetical protein